MEDFTMKKTMKLLMSMFMVMLFVVAYAKPAEAATKKLADLNYTEGKSVAKEESITTPTGKTYSKNVVRYDASLDAWASYNINKKYDVFKGVFVTSKSTGNGNFNIYIYGDGQLLKTYKGIANNNQNKSFSVNVTGVKTLKIVTDNTGSYSNGFVYIANGTLQSTTNPKTVTLKSGKTVSASLTVGSKTTLKIKNVTKGIKWSSSKKTVAKVSTKGVVTAVKPGTATITAKVGGKTYKCKITVVNASAKAKSVKFKNATGGEFVKGASKATVSFKLNNASTNVVVKVLDSDGKAVYTKKFAKCKKDEKYSFTWDGKNSKGKYVSKGLYKVCIIAGKTKTYSKELLFNNQEFAGGDGSKKNPYKVSNVKQLKAVAKHNGMYFKQTKDIDFDYEALQPLYSKDNPFVGYYNGNFKNIININSLFDDSECVGIFAAIGEKGTVVNLKVKDSIFKGDTNVGAIAGVNNGVIQNCKAIDCNITSSWQAGGICGKNTKRVKKCSSENNTINAQSDSYSRWISSGGIIGYNIGIIDTCTVKASQILSYSNDSVSLVGGIAGFNEEGTIKNCSGDNLTLKGGQRYAQSSIGVGGVVGRNEGTIQYCHMNIKSITAKDNYNETGYYGGVVGYNCSIISGCSYEGCDKATGYNSGTIV